MGVTAGNHTIHGGLDKTFTGVLSSICTSTISTPSDAYSRGRYVVKLGYVGNFWS